jgi:glycosyltransferase involved in cell wall biosynthesis
MVLQRPLILIPSFNTGPILRKTVLEVLEGATPVWVVIDGSTDGSPELIADLVSPGHPTFEIVTLARNSGKGAAILHGTRKAVAAGFTHIVTLDADGQHPASYIPQYLEISARHPDAALLGCPIFDSSAPAVRVAGRKISNFWADLETLRWGIGDSLFGMRLYPAQKLLEAFESTSFARRFDFDPEIAVRLAWAGVPLINIPTPVRYPSKDQGGVSQFRYLRDNILLTWMHSRLMLGFAARLPALLSRGRNPLAAAYPPPA